MERFQTAIFFEIWRQLKRRNIMLCIKNLQLEWESRITALLCKRFILVSLQAVQILPQSSRWITPLLSLACGNTGWTMKANFKFPNPQLCFHSPWFFASIVDSISVSLFMLYTVPSYEHTDADTRGAALGDGTVARGVGVLELWTVLLGEVSVVSAEVGFLWIQKHRCFKVWTEG